MTKRLKLLSILFLVILNIITILLLPHAATTNILADEAYGKIVITILEKGTNIPIDNANICIVETREYFKTNKNGITDLITIPIFKSKHLDNILSQNFGEITILAYKPTYTDHLYFYKNVPIKQTRYGIIIHLTPIYSESDITPTITNSSYDIDYIKQLIEVVKK